jgi:hypothetical protein
VPEGIFDRLIGAALLRQVGALHRGTQADAQGLGSQLGRNQTVCLLGELPGLGLRDAGQVVGTQVPPRCSLASRRACRYPGGCRRR